MIIFMFDPKEEVKERYQEAYAFVMQVEEKLRTQTAHYYTKSGVLLRTLDQVIHAAISNNLTIKGGK